MLTSVGSGARQGSPGAIPPGVAGPVRRARKRIWSVKATAAPHLGHTHLLRGIAAVVVEALLGKGRAPAHGGPRLAPLRDRIWSVKATTAPHLGHTHLLRGIAAVVVETLLGKGRAPAPGGPRLAPL